MNDLARIITEIEKDFMGDPQYVYWVWMSKGTWLALEKNEYKFTQDALLEVPYEQYVHATSFSKAISDIHKFPCECFGEIKLIPMGILWRKPTISYNNGSFILKEDNIYCPNFVFENTSSPFGNVMIDRNPRA